MTKTVGCKDITNNSCIKLICIKIILHCISKVSKTHLIDPINRINYNLHNSLKGMITSKVGLAYLQKPTNKICICKLLLISRSIFGVQGNSIYQTS